MGPTVILQMKPTVLLTSSRVDFLDPKKEHNNEQDGSKRALAICL